MQIYYFTRSHRSEKIAGELAERKGLKTNKIDDGQSWKGIVGFIRAGMYASRGKSIPCQYEPPMDGETIVVVFPIWASNFPPAVRTFIDQVGRDRIICIPTSGSSLLKDWEGFIRVIDLSGKNISAPTDL